MARQTKRLPLLLLTGAGLALALWLLRPVPLHPLAKGLDVAAGITQAPVAAEALPGAPALERIASRRKPLRIEDRLSAAPLDLTVRVLDGEQELETLRPGDVVDLSSLPPEVTLSYRLGSQDLEHAVPLGECLRENAAAWLLAVPYTCRLEFELLSADLPPAGERGQVLLCLDPRLVPEPPAAEERLGPFSHPVQNMSLEGLLTWRLRSSQLKSVASAALSAQDPAPLTISAAGDFVACVQFAGGASGVSPVLLTPGEIVRVPVDLRARPTLKGRLLDWDGQPVPAEKIILTVALDLDDYDLRLTDPHGLMAYRQEGVLTQSVKKTYVTDADGRFELSVPRGKEYAVYTYAREGYAFWSTMGVSHADRMEVELRLAAPSVERDVLITVLQADGQPLSLARIELALAGDLPFFRQWPTGITLDEQGSVTVPGLQPGQVVGVVIHHDSLTSGVYAPKYPTVPASRRIELRLPAESLLAFQ